MGSGERWRLGHRPALDGLRGVAILLVLIGHTFAPYWRSELGSAGVTLFFVLSGFLITSLLLEGQSLSRFWRNRAVRLLPALCVLAVIVGAVQLAIGRWDWWVIPSVLLYVGNWGRAAGVDMGLFGHTWSLAIEEQFYVVWPLLLVVIPRKRVPVAIAAGIMAAIGLRFILWPDVERIYAGSDTRADAILVGCLLAYLAQRGTLTRARVPGWAAVFAVVGLIAVGLGSDPLTRGILVPTVVPWFAALLVWAACVRPPVVFLHQWLRYLGTRSYALYLWHYPLLLLAELAGLSFGWRLVALALSLGLTELSWRLVESKAQRLRRSHDVGNTTDELVTDSAPSAGARG